MRTRTSRPSIWAFRDGVDHIDGHRSPGYVISPYVVQSQNGQPVVNHTAFTQINMTRTIEQILGLPPMNQFDLVASPMYNLFTDNPPAANFAPWDHVAATVSLCTTGASNTPPYYRGVLAGFTVVNGVCVPSATATAKNIRKLKPIEKAWALAKNKIFSGKQHIPESEDPVVVNHWAWYEATGYTRPYPGPLERGRGFFMSAPRGRSHTVSRRPKQKKTPLAAGSLSPACVWRSCSCFYPVLRGLRRAQPTRSGSTFYWNPLASLLPSRGNVASLACYISNAHASGRVTTSDVTCCIWDVVQV